MKNTYLWYSLLTVFLLGFNTAHAQNLNVEGTATVGNLGDDSAIFMNAANSKSGVIRLQDDGDAGFQFYIGGLPTMTIGASNVGIGLNSVTAAPDAKLSILNFGSNDSLKMLGFGEGGASDFWFGSGFAGAANDNYIFMNTPNGGNTMSWRANGNVGIGTTSPSQKLEIVGNTLLGRGNGLNTVERELTLSGARGAGNNFSFAKINFNNYDDDSDAVDYTGARINATNVTGENSGDLRFSTNDGSGLDIQMTIDETGNVGIGTTNPAKKLQVVGTARVSILQSSGMPVIEGQGAYLGWNQDGSKGRMLLANQKGLGVGGFEFVTYDNNNAIVETPMLIDENGDVGIGTTNPTERLEVAGNVKASKFIGDGSMLTNINDGDADDMNEIQDLMLSGNTLSLTNDATTVDLRNYENNWEINDREIVFGFNNNETAVRSSAVGDSNDATANSSSAFGHDNSASGESSSAFGYINFAETENSSAIGFNNLARGDHSTAIGYNNYARGGYSSAFGYVSDADGEESSAFGFRVSADVFGVMAVGRYNVTQVGSPTTWVPTEPIFVIGNGENSSNRSTAVTVLKNGDVGIGTTSVSSRLHIKQRGNISSNGIRIEATDGTFWNTYVDVSDDYNFANNGTLRAYIQDGAGSFIITSDRSLKTNIEPLKSVLEGVLQLEPKWYNYVDNEKGTPKTLGFIAQEVEAYFPQIVRQKGDFKALAYDDFGILAIKAIQELNDKMEAKDMVIEKITTQNSALEQQNKALEERLSELELKMDAIIGKCCQIDITENTQIESLTSATLQQNAPNPFDESTTIEYFIPAQVRSASLQVMNANGIIIKSIPIQDTGKGQITLQANLLSAGTYSYSLVLDGRVTETKQMVLTH